MSAGLCGGGGGVDGLGLHQQGAFCSPALWEALFIRALNWPHFLNKSFEVFCAWLIDSINKLLSSNPP